MRSKLIFLVAVVFPFGFLGSAFAGPIVVSSTEVWAGSVMHGIAPSGSGTPNDPYVYAIPEGLVLTAAGVLQMNDTYVVFDFHSGTGGLDMAVGSYFDLTGSSRLSDPGTCTIILGENDLTGAGDFTTVDIAKDSMDVSITGSGNVTVNSFYMRTKDALPGSVEVDIGGSLNVASIDTQDEAVGGNDGGDVTVRAGDVTVGSIDTRALRTNSSDRFSGSVVLEARNFAGTSTLENTVSLYGTINTDAVTGIDGAVEILGVVVTLESGFGAVTGDGSVQIYAGMVQYGISAEELFVDNSGGGYSAVHSVFWTGPGAEFYALYPQPAYNTEGVLPDVVLRWTPGICASFHDVYLGTSFEDVDSAVEPNVLPGRGRQDVNSYSLEDWLEFGTTYYWRIDEVNEPNIWKGAVWTFSVADGKAANPSPSDNASSTPAQANLSWTPGVFAVSHDVYFGTDYNAVSDANTATPLDMYIGRQEANSLNCGVLDLNTTYYWRIDEVTDSSVVKGDIWSFRTTINVIDHAIVYYEGGKFAGWPANNGLLWNWGDDEVVVGFVQADFECKGGHNNTGSSYNVLARSLDGGTTWTTFDTEDFIGDGGSSGPSPGVNFADAHFAMRIDEEEYYVSYDRCQSWEGPYDMGTFGEATVDSWENTSRTDYIVNGPNDCLVFMSVKPVGGAFGTDRAFCIRTTDGGVTFQFQGWIVPPADPYRGVMPSTVRCSPTKLVSALRRRNMSESCDAWVDVYVSNDNGVNWSFLSKVGDTGCENGNPPALVRLSDGRLCCVYGNRTDMRMYMKYSDDEGASWTEQITLRDDWADCADDHQDLGYPRITQLANETIICAYYWSTPERIENHIAATIWDPGTEPPDPNASNPKPSNDGTDVPRNQVLSWSPGYYADAHDVYLGTGWDDVNQAGTSSPEYKARLTLDANSYDPCGLLDLRTTYYWRIDEVAPPNIFKGSVWKFTAADFLTIDDFESYGTTSNYITDTWIDGFLGFGGNYTGSILNLGLESSGDPVQNGEKSMSYGYNCYVYSCSELKDVYYAEAELLFESPQNWTEGGTKLLTLFFYGQQGNDAGDTEQMYVAIRDSNDNYAEVRYGDAGENMNDLALEQWQQWNVPLSDFYDANQADVNYVTSLYIGFGHKGGAVPGGSGTVYFDDIRRSLPICIPAAPLADITDDCVVDFEDLDMMARHWLQDGDLVPDLYDDDTIDFKDFALLAESWLENNLWP